MRRRKSRAARRLLKLDGVGNQVSDVAQRPECQVAVVLLGRVSEDAQELVGRKAEESPCLLIQFRPNVITRDHDVLVFVGQPLGPVLDGRRHLMCIAVRMVRIAWMGVGLGSS